jgi:endo-1,4-beta-xylanase
MNTQIQRSTPWIGLLAAALLAISATAQAADNPTLKDTYKDHFYVGVAINQTIVTGDSVRADNVNRNMEQVNKDIALVKEQFNQISPENDLKWQLIHPREGADGYNFGPADTRWCGTARRLDGFSKALICRPV